MDTNTAPVDARHDAQDAPRRRGRPPKKREPRRRKIIAEAADLFISHGYSETTLEAVAKNAGVNKRTIYELVGDKEELFREVCRQNSTIGELNLDGCIDRRSLRNSLLALARRLFEHSLSDRVTALEQAVIAESRRFPELIEEIVSSNYLEANREVHDYLEKLQGLGMIRIDEERSLSELFFDMIVGQIAFRKFLGHSHFDPGIEYLEDRVELFMRCLRLTKDG